MSRVINIPEATGIMDPTTGNIATINDDGQLHVVLRGAVCDGCSTATPLTAGNTFTGTAHDVLDYGIIFVSAKSDVASATDGFSLQQSPDGTNWDVTDEYTLAANAGKTFAFQPACKYFRVTYENGSTPQTYFRLQTTFKKTNSLPSSHRISDPIVNDDDARLVKSVLTGRNPADTFINFEATTAGNFKCSLEELENNISVNSNEQLKVTQFDSSGNEGQKIIGIDYLAGNSGIDASTESLQTIEYEHHEIHSGSHYNYCDYALAQGIGDEIEFVFVTPNTTKWVHLLFEVYASTGATIELYEGTSGVSGGTAITPRNNNRNSANISAVTLTKDPAAITTDGTRAAGFLAGGTRVAGAVERNKEYVLDQNNTYLVRITSLAASNNISWCAEWYEHTDKN